MTKKKSINYGFRAKVRKLLRTQIFTRASSDLFQRDIVAQPVIGSNSFRSARRANFLHFQRWNVSKLRGINWSWFRIGTAAFTRGHDLRLMSTTWRNC